MSNKFLDKCSTLITCFAPHRAVKRSFLPGLAYSSGERINRFIIIFFFNFLLLLLDTQQYSKESIQQLVMDAETLVREELLMKTPQRNGRHSFSEAAAAAATLSPSRKPKTPAVLDTHPKIKRVQEWLEHQPIATNCPPPLLSRTATTTDCEASGEYTGK